MHRDDNLRWVKSSYSGGSGTECVEVATVVGDVSVRDSKLPHRARIDIGASAWEDFVSALRLESWDQDRTGDTGVCPLVSPQPTPAGLAVHK